MPRDEFDRDLNEYLSARKRASRFNIKGLFVRFLPKRSEKPTAPPVEMPESVEVYEEPKERPSLFSTFKSSSKNMFSSLKSDKESEELATSRMQAEDAVNDMKEVAKITLGMIKTLPDEQLRHFKKSPDFDRLKALLKKHELIK